MSDAWDVYREQMLAVTVGAALMCIETTNYDRTRVFAGLSAPFLFGTQVRRAKGGDLKSEARGHMLLLPVRMPQLLRAGLLQMGAGARPCVCTVCGEYPSVSSVAAPSATGLPMRGASKALLHTSLHVTTELSRGATRFAGLKRPSGC